MSHQAITDSYCRLMLEIKSRIAVIDSLLKERLFTSKNIGAIEGRINYEICFLQFRMICELIATACLVAHGDIDPNLTKELKEKWHAGEVVKELSKLHPDFYPRPERSKPFEGPDLSSIPHPSERDALAKNEFLELYGRCGNELHRGPMQATLNPPKKKKTEADVVRWRQKIIDLLNEHHISLIVPGQELWCTMEDQNGNVNVNIMQLVGRLPDGDRDQ
jgi:hypothetical protein